MLTGKLKALWRGEISLVKTYWIYGCLTGAIISTLISLISEASLASMNIKVALSIIIVLSLVLMCYEVVLLVGIWRAADKYEGRKLWSFLAKTAVILGILGNIVASVSVFDSVRQLITLQGLIDNKEIQYTRYDGWQDIDIPGRFSFQIPPTMEMQSETYKAITDNLVPEGSPYSAVDTIVIYQKGLSNGEPKAFETYARIMINPDQASDTPEIKIGDDLRTMFTQQDLDALSDILKSGIEDLIPQNPLDDIMKIISWNGTSIIDVNNYTCFVTNFIRTINDNPPVQVYQYIIIDDKKIYSIIISYRLEDAVKWEKDLKRVINTFYFN